LDLAWVFARAHKRKTPAGCMTKARPEMKHFHDVKPAVDDFLTWESWLYPEVPMNMSEEEHMSVSFNYAWG